MCSTEACGKSQRKKEKNTESFYCADNPMYLNWVPFSNQYCLNKFTIHTFRNKAVTVSINTNFDYIEFKELYYNLISALCYKNNKHLS